MPIACAFIFLIGSFIKANKMTKALDLTSEKFDFLTVLKIHHINKTYNTTYKRNENKRFWLCKCVCGNEVIRSTSNLRDKNRIHSCGCQISYKVRERNKEKYAKLPYYQKLISRWCKVKERLYNPNSISFPNYGGRGIKMCDEWKNDSFAFYTWAIHNGFEPHLLLDRINNDRNYCPENCRWVDRKTQNRNTRKNVFITYEGETLCMAEWAEKLGVTLKHFWYKANKNNKDYTKTIELIKKEKIYKKVVDNK